MPSNTGDSRVKDELKPNPKVVKFVEAALPEHHRKLTIEWLAKRKLATGAYIRAALLSMFSIVEGNWRSAFRWGLLIDAVALWYSFHGQPFGWTLAYVITAGLLGLVFADSYIHPPQNRPVDQGVCAWVAIVFILVEQYLAGKFAPHYVLGPDLMLPGFLLGILTVSMSRTFLRPAATPEEGPNELGKLPPSAYAGIASFKWTRFIAWSWFAAATIFLIGPLPDFIVHHGFPYTLPQLAPLVFLLGFRSQKNCMGGMFAGGFTWVMQNHKLQELQHLEDTTYAPASAKKSGNIPWPLVLEFLAYFLYCLPLIISVVLYLSGHTNSLDRNGGRDFSDYAVACVSLGVVWVAIRRLNQQMADAIRAAIAEAKAFPKMQSAESVA